MKIPTIDITSSILNKLNGTTKDLINYGVWFLYEVDYNANENVKYLLSTDTQDFLLANDGSALGIYPKNTAIEYKTRINFEDIPKPPVLNIDKPLWA